MKIIKSLKSDRSLSHLSTKELKTVKGGGLVGWVPPHLGKPNDGVTADPPPEITSSLRYKFT